MKISLEDLLIRMNHPRNYLKGQLPQNTEELSLEVHTLRQGRVAGQPNYDEDTRVAAGALGRLIGPTEAARATGMTQANASYLKRAYSSSQEKHEELNEKIEEKLGDYAPPNDLWTKPNRVKELESKLSQARTSALETMLASIENIHPAKLLDEKPKVLAGIAKDMAAVLNQTNPQGSTNNLGIKVVINTVDRKEESSYEVVEVQM